MNWAQIEAWANEALVRARAKNDGDLTESETAKLRGRIDALKELIALPAKRLVMEAQSRTVLPE